LVLHLTDQRQQRLAIQAIDPSRQRSYASNLDRGTGQIAARSTGSLGLELFQLLLQLAVALEHATELVQQILAVALDQRRGFFQLLLGAVQVVQCLLAGDRLDTTHASRHTAFAGDLEQADVTGALDVGPAAQLDGETTTHGQYAHLIAVFLAEQHHGALALGRLDIGFLDFNGSRSEEHTSELQSRENLVCRLLLEKKKNTKKTKINT